MNDSVSTWLVVKTQEGPMLLKINESTLMVNEDIQGKISPKQELPVLGYHQAADRAVMIVHPAAISRVINKLRKGDNRFSYEPLPKSLVQDASTTMVDEKELNSFIEN